MLITHYLFRTLLNVLVLVVRSESILPVQAAEGVDKMRAQVGVDVLGVVFGSAWPIHTPVRIVAHHPLLS